MTEIWKQIKGYEGKYEVSNYGKVRSLNFNNIKHKIKLLKPLNNNRGYLQVRLSNRWYKVHRLVAEAFIPNLNNYSEVNHIDEDKCNNRVDNLEWCSRTYNVNYGTRGLKQSLTLTGRPCPTRKKVICLETGQIFDSAKAAYNHVGVSKDYFLKKVMKYGYKAHGYSFKYLNGDIK